MSVMIRRRSTTLQTVEILLYYELSLFVIDAVNNLQHVSFLAMKFVNKVLRWKGLGISFERKYLDRRSVFFICWMDDIVIE
jgi:hypothetical protein